MPKRPRIHQPLGSRRARAQRLALYRNTPARRASQSLYDHAWREYSKRRLAEFPYCARCLKLGRTRRAVVTDHIQPHKCDPVLFRDPTNHQSLCKHCHDRKTWREDGGFGRQRQVAAFYPGDLRPASCHLTLVCGPPAAGKSTYVREHAQRGDIVIDLDVLIAEHSGLPLYHGKDAHLRTALAERNEMLRELATMPPERRAWFVISAPIERRQWWTRMLAPADVVVLAVPMDECLRRVEMDTHRTAAAVTRQHQDAVRAWFRAEFGYRQKLHAVHDRRAFTGKENT